MIETDGLGDRAFYGPPGGRLPRGAELKAAVTRALFYIYARFIGRGPLSAFTFHHDNVVVTVMRGVLTPAGRAPALHGEAQLIGEARGGIRETLEPEFRRAVRELTGQRVLAFMGGESIDSDISTELLILGGQL